MSPIWQETYSFLPKEQVNLLLDKYFSVKNIESFLASGYEYYSVNGEGVLVVLEQEVGLYVDKLYLLPSARGKNLPKKVFEFLLKRGKKLYLNVNKNNKRAINCYLKNGFKITKQEDILLGNGLINCDYVME
jgi:ribosomal protein S18 acetylase RimI-like enzyme